MNDGKRKKATLWWLAAIPALLVAVLAGTQVAGGQEKGPDEGAFISPSSTIKLNDGQLTLDPAPELGQPAVSFDQVKKNLAADPYAQIAVESGVEPELYFGAYTNLTRGEVDKASAEQVGLANARIKLTHDHVPMVLALFRQVPAKAMAGYVRGAGALDPEGEGRYKTFDTDVLVLVDPKNGTVLSTTLLDRADP